MADEVKKPEREVLGSHQAKADRKLRDEAAPASAKYEFTVSEGTTYYQKEGLAPLYHGDQVDPELTEGGLFQVRRYVSAGFVIQADPNVVRTNRGEYDIKILKAVSHGGRILSPGESYMFRELDVAGKPEFEGVDEYRRLVKRVATPDQLGEEFAKDWIERGFAEPPSVLSKVRTAAKRLVGGKSAKAGEA